jgi:hypothetical protein
MIWLTREFRRICAKVPSGFPRPDGTSRLFNAARAQNVWRKVLLEATTALTVLAVQPPTSLTVSVRKLCKGISLYRTEDASIWRRTKLLCGSLASQFRHNCRR